MTTIGMINITIGRIRIRKVGDMYYIRIPKSYITTKLLSPEKGPYTVTLTEVNE